MASRLINLFILFSLSLLATIPISSESHHLHLYFHERNTGPNSTTIVSVPVNGPALVFGSIVVINDELRVGADPNSELVGRAQGFLPVVSTQQENVLLFASNFVFMEGSEYNGSTLDVFGRNVLAAETRDWTIIGGTGQFKMARGYVHGKRLTSPAGTLLIELDIYVVHHGD